MKRLYYITDRIEVVESISETLRQVGVSDWNFHVLSRDKAGLSNHHIHSTTPLQERDVIHVSQQGGIIGGVLGLGIAGVLMVTEVLPATPLGFLGFATLFFVFLMHGMWTGGLIGLQRENYKIRKFHRDLEVGRYLIMIDAATKDERAIRNLVSQYADAIPRGEDSTFTTPFGSGTRPLQS